MHNFVENNAAETWELDRVDDKMLHAVVFQQPRTNRTARNAFMKGRSIRKP